MYTCLRARKSNCVQGTESPYRSCQWWCPATDAAATTTTAAAATTAAATAATAVATAAATTTAATTTAADIYLVMAVKISA